jgi:hypothetical protein
LEVDESAAHEPAGLLIDVKSHILDRAILVENLPDALVRVASRNSLNVDAGVLLEFKEGLDRMPFLFLMLLVHFCCLFPLFQFVDALQFEPSLFFPLLDAFFDLFITKIACVPSARLTEPDHILVLETLWAQGFQLDFFVSS